MLHTRKDETLKQDIVLSMLDDLCQKTREFDCGKIRRPCVTQLRENQLSLERFY